MHPEAYPIVAKMLADTGSSADKLIGNMPVLKTLQAARYIDAQFGLPTVMDILSELEKPGRDPRGEFKTATFADGIDDIKHLVVGSIMEGVVTNVAAFGAFVDVGVHQDGLVHISALSKQYVSDPHTVVKAGQVVIGEGVERGRGAQAHCLDHALGRRHHNRQPKKSCQQQHGRWSTWRAPWWQ